MRNKAIFLDKDGTLIKDVPYNVDPEKIQILPGVIEGLSLLQKKGYSLFVVSNQSGLARGYFDEQALDQAFDALQEKFADRDIFLHGIYFCPHHTEGTVQKYTGHCHCRKPQESLIVTAAGEHNIQLSKSWMIGDILHDVEAGNRAGCRTILIDNGHETEWNITPTRIPSLIVPDFLTAALHILDNERVVQIDGEHLTGSQIF